jgi:hypothetical protein
MNAAKNLSVETRCYGGKSVFVFEDHSVALLPWAKIRSECADPLILLTLVELLAGKPHSSTKIITETQKTSGLDS